MAMSAASCSSSAKTAASTTTKATTTIPAAVTTANASTTSTTSEVSTTSQDVTTTSDVTSDVSLPSSALLDAIKPAVLPSLVKMGYTEKEASCFIDAMFSDPNFLKTFTSGGGAPKLGPEFVASMQKLASKCVTPERMIEIGKKVMSTTT